MEARVLIVEDEENIGRDFELYLRGIPQAELDAIGIRQFHIEHAKWGNQARELLQSAGSNNQPYDVTLLDLQLPEREGLRFQDVETGFRLAQLARDRNASKKVIVVSAYDENVVRAYRQGVDDFVPKPTKPETLVERFTFAWMRMLEAESERVRRVRLERLIAEVYLSSATRFGTCFSDFLRAVANTATNLREDLTARLDQGTGLEPGDPVANRLGEFRSAIDAKQGWQQLRTELLPQRRSSAAQFTRQLRSAMVEAETCCLVQGSMFRIIEFADATVSCDSDDLESILREMLLGPILEKQQAGIEINLELMREDPWIFVRVRDNGPSLDSGTVDRINNGYLGMPDENFGRIWGLSIVQHTAIRSGGKLSVRASKSGNEVTYQIPLIEEGADHADSIRGGERPA